MPRTLLFLLNPTVVARFESEESFTFDPDTDLLRGEPFPSLFITSASALPIEARFKECRSVLRVVRFAGLAASAGLVATLAIVSTRELASV